MKWLGGMVNKVRNECADGSPFWRDRSFDSLLECCKGLRPILNYLPDDLKSTAYEGQDRVETVYSSYKDHGYGYFFYALSRALRPRNCIELGVLHGFSLLSVAAGLRDNGSGIIHGIDRFEEYPYRHARLADTKDHMRGCGLAEWSGVTRADALLEDERHRDLDYLHVDLSNDGDTYRFVFRHWAHKVRQVILLEGGSPDRDRVEWMEKYKKPLIVPAIDEIRREYPDWVVAVLAPFPSLTVAVRRRDEK